MEFAFVASLLDLVDFQQFDFGVARCVLASVGDALHLHLEELLLASVLPARVNHRRVEVDRVALRVLVAQILLEQRLTVATPQADVGVGAQTVLQITFVSVQREDALTVREVSSVSLRRSLF